MSKSQRALKREARRKKRKEAKRKQIRRIDRVGSLWNEDELIVFVGKPLEQLGPGVDYCPDCGVLISEDGTH